MRVLFLVPLLGLTLGPRAVVGNTITSYTVTEVEEDTGATDAGNGDIGVWPDNSDVVDADGRPLVHRDAYAVGKGIQTLFRYCIEAISGAAPEAETDVDGGAAGLVGWPALFAPSPGLRNRDSCLLGLGRFSPRGGR